MSLVNIDATNSEIMSEISELFKNIAQERIEYQQNKIIKEVAFECVNDGEIDATLGNKVNNILMDSEVVKSNEVAPGKSLLVNSLLSNDTSLEPDEGEILNYEVEKRLKNKENEIAEEFLQLGHDIRSESVADELRNFEKDQIKALIDLKCVLDNKRHSYIESLEKLLSVYEEILKLKFETFPCVVNDKAELLQLQTKTMRLKSELLNSKAKVSMFTENNRSLQAYKEILKDIQQEQTECKVELEKHTELREKYKKVSSKQYNEILEKYLVYKARLESFK